MPFPPDPEGPFPEADKPTLLERLIDRMTISVEVSLHKILYALVALTLLATGNNIVSAVSEPNIQATAPEAHVPVTAGPGGTTPAKRG
ncbi:MAG TPA: hypothetical protein VFP12_08125 [Allosphingosinicella sp.]|nr:hypothetical protein [Allosphingosinicella sp.]